MEGLTGGFTTDEIDEMATASKLAHSQQPHKFCELSKEDGYGRKHILHWYICHISMTKPWVELLQDTLMIDMSRRDKNGHWNMSLNRHYVWRQDRGHLDIFCPTIVLSVYANCGEIMCFTRMKSNGIIDLNSFKSYIEVKTNYDEKYSECMLHGDISDPSFWISHPELCELAKLRIPDILTQFCHVFS